MALALAKNERSCLWVDTNLTRCLRPTYRGTNYCFAHTSDPDVHIELLADDEADALRERWTAELDEECRQSKRKSKNKTRHLRAKDFPKWVDGLKFDSIDEYYLYHTGSSFEEMAGTDVHYFDRHPRSSYSQYGQGAIQFPTGGGSYIDKGKGVFTPVRPHKRLERGTYQLVESIEHMRYVVVRLENGKYHPVFISMNLPLPENGLGLIMAAVQKTILPCGVTETPWGRFHSTGKSSWDYWGAEGGLQRGGESFWKTKDRIEKAKDPNWVPPNLRQLAINGDYQFIPISYHSWLKQWVKDGCKGWFASTTPRKKKQDKRMSRLFDIKRTKGAS